MSLVPIGSNAIDGMQMGRGIPISDDMTNKYSKAMEEGYEPFEINTMMFSQFGGAEMLAKKYQISRDEADDFAFLSQKRAAEATKANKFAKEIVPIEARVGEKFKGKPASGPQTVDEGIRPTTRDGLRKLKALHAGGGIITPGNASQICDGAAAVMICNERGLQKLGLKPRAKIVALALAGADPVVMLEGPIPATKKVLAQASLTIKDIDRYEVNEAFCSVPLSWKKALGADMEKLNVNGGAMALGHPLGGTGAKLMTTLLHELERCEGRYGVLAICEGGGTANATVIERLTEGRAKL